jgi:thiamine kinase-like enzyme
MTVSLENIRQALAHSQWHDYPLKRMEDTGLAHDHVRLQGSGWLLRLPKQSQMNLDGDKHLIYEAACFERAAPSDYTPAFADSLPCSDDLPRGALVVQAIEGRIARLPDDLPDIMSALAAIHSLPLPLESERAPLFAPADPLKAMAEEVEAQAAFLQDAGLGAAEKRLIEDECQQLYQLARSTERPPACLITFDAHPGNFVINDDNNDDNGKTKRAWMVDLEKSRYSYPAFDLAHATLYTSTTWDPRTYAELSVSELVNAYRQWEAQMPEKGSAHRRWHIPLRRAMWLWSTTWCAKWRVQSGAAPSQESGGQNWSTANNSDNLNTHVRDRVDHYLSLKVIERMRHEFSTLEEKLKNA